VPALYKRLLLIALKELTMTRLLIALNTLALTCVVALGVVDSQPAHVSGLDYHVGQGVRQAVMGEGSPVIQTRSSERLSF